MEIGFIFNLSVHGSLLKVLGLWGWVWLHFGGSLSVLELKFDWSCGFWDNVRLYSTFCQKVVKPLNYWGISWNLEAWVGVMSSMNLVVLVFSFSVFFCHHWCFIITAFLEKKRIGGGCDGVGLKGLNIWNFCFRNETTLNCEHLIWRL